MLLQFFYCRFFFLFTVDDFSRKRGTIILAGSKGIGKSCQGLLMVVEFVKRRRIVLFEFGNTKIMIIGPDAWNDPTKNVFDNGTVHMEQTNQEILTRVFNKEGFEHVTSEGVYEFPVEYHHLFELLSFQHPFVHIVDVGENYQGTISTVNRKIIISSPNSEKLKRTGEDDPPRMVYLSTWTYEEIKTLNSELPAPSKTLEYSAVQKSEDDLKKLFEIFGGKIPRENFSKSHCWES